MENEVLLCAIQNNALWCDLICCIAKVPGEFSDGLWTNTNNVPVFYPNIITIKPISSDSALMGTFYTSLQNLSGKVISVKDSYSELDLSDFGFKRIIEAEWIALEQKRIVEKSSQWQRVNSEKKLFSWVGAWSKEEEAGTDAFTPLILREEDVWICGDYVGGEFIKGAVLFMNDNTLGISNVFSQTQIDEDFWSELRDFIGVNFPGRLIVGYESGNNLATALAAGFDSVGSLCIWKK